MFKFTGFIKKLAGGLGYCICKGKEPCPGRLLHSLFGYVPSEAAATAKNREVYLLQNSKITLFTTSSHLRIGVLNMSRLSIDTSLTRISTRVRQIYIERFLKGIYRPRDAAVTLYRKFDTNDASQRCRGDVWSLHMCQATVIDKARFSSTCMTLMTVH